jgi:alpha-beta hydrolase superfamily lysophospholipase
MIWVFIGILFLSGAVIWISRFCYRLAFYSLNEKEQDLYAVPPGKQYEAVAERILELIYEVDQLSYELVSITSGDGLHLVGRYYHFKDNAPVQILFHGYRSNGRREFSGNNRIAMNMGFNVIVVDERAHGKSGGHTITFGIKERYDCLAWAQYAAERFGPETPIVLSGVSMGAATVLMASSLPLPMNVAGIIADCPYSSPGEIIRKVSRDVKLPPFLSYPFVVIGALLFGKFKLWETSAVEAVKHTRIPVLLIHGDDDRFVPCWMSKKIYAACKGKAELSIFHGAGHALSYFTDTARYETIIEAFLKSCGVLK